MKHIAALVAALLLVFMRLPSQAQQAPDDQYVIIYGLMQRADALNDSKQIRPALEAYVEAQNQLQKFNRLFPTWNPKIVTYRLNYIAQKIAEVTGKLPVAVAPAPAPPATPASSADQDAQLRELRDQLQKLQASNVILESKLKEALTMQPAASDPNAFTKAQEQIRTLMKENDLLKVSLAQNVRTAAGGADAEALRQARQALAEATQKLAEQTQRANSLAQQNQTLQASLQKLTAGTDVSEALRQENEVLKKQVASLQTSLAKGATTPELSTQLTRAQAQIAQLQVDAQTAWGERQSLQNRVKELTLAASSTATKTDARIRELEKERDNLLTKLGEANKKLSGGKKPNTVAQIDDLAQQVETLRARLAVDEAQPVPYAPEELALLKQPAPSLAANPDAEKKSSNDLPGGVMTLVAEAQSHFAARQYDQAENDYLKILQHDAHNGLALANLATIELQQGKLADADQHINAALKQSPDDAYDLSILGYLKFRQEKYDDALDALSRAAKLSPQNPEIQNYLGVTLSHKGLRTQAETALRKAIQLDPNYGAAHNNLAVIYLSQQPPLFGLARWHYQKALDGGAPRNPELEKILDGKGDAEKAQ